MHKFIQAACLALATLPMLASATSANYPTRPITLVVPFAAGGGTDSIARDIAKGMSDRLGQSVIVVNKGGAGGALGADYVAKSKPDGYTLLFATSTFATNAAVETKLPYDAITSFTPVAMIGRGPLLVVTSNDLGVRSVAELIEVAKSRPEGLNFCSAGNGSINHLAGELFRQKANLEMTHVPFKGSAPATMELMAGRVDLFFATFPTILTHAKENKVTALAVTGNKRSRLFPDLPTMSESGIADFDITTWWGILAPADTPASIVTLLNQAVNETAAAEPVRGRLLHEGADPIRLTPAAFSQELVKELSLWRKVADNPAMQLR